MDGLPSWLIPALVGAVVGFIIAKATGTRDDTRIIYNETDLKRADPTVQALVMRDEMIEAIKLHRKLSGADLKAAKDYCDSLREHLRAHPPA